MLVCQWMRRRRKQVHLFSFPHCSVCFGVETLSVRLHVGIGRQRVWVWVSPELAFWLSLSRACLPYPSLSSGLNPLDCVFAVWKGLLFTLKEWAWDCSGGWSGISLILFNPIFLTHAQAVCWPWEQASHCFIWITVSLNHPLPVLKQKEVVYLLLLSWKPGMVVHLWQFCSKCKWRIHSELLWDPPCSVTFAKHLSDKVHPALCRVWHYQAFKEFCIPSPVGPSCCTQTLISEVSTA